MKLFVICGQSEGLSVIDRNVRGKRLGFVVSGNKIRRTVNEKTRNNHRTIVKYFIEGGEKKEKE